ncbi:hypothetical protein [Pseudomonas monteilii]|uniref:hypothetical protein n=1 Tax=Pseudomonas monteilii TaxID=76759 RepID=UPI0015F9C206|nr:hypothetical protein [Pseudomonas monteilii]MBA6101710.1 hypothetical protein [Pseudomonas monteilii]
MTQAYKKEKERVYANAAARALGESWVIKDVSEPLDFIVRVPGDEHFGLEVVELYDSPVPGGGSRLKQAHGRQQRNLRDIISGYYQAGGKPVRVNFLGCIDNVKEIIEALVIASNSLANDEIRIEMCGLQTWVLPLPLGDSRFENYGRWQIADAGFIRQISDELVLQQINKKSQKIELYRKKACAIDLLLVVDRTINAGRFIVSDKLKCANTGFRRVILLNYPLDARILSPTRD